MSQVPGNKPSPSREGYNLGGWLPEAQGMLVLACVIWMPASWNAGQTASINCRQSQDTSWSTYQGTQLAEVCPSPVGQAVTQYRPCAIIIQAGIHTLICPLLDQQPITIQEMDLSTCTQWNAFVRVQSDHFRCNSACYVTECWLWEPTKLNYPTTGTTTPGQSRSRSNGNEEVLFKFPALEPHH